MKTHTNRFSTYGQEWGEQLLKEAKARGMTRTELIRKSTTEYLANNPVEDREAA